MSLKFVTASLSPPFGTGATSADFHSSGTLTFHHCKNSFNHRVVTLVAWPNSQRDSLVVVSSSCLIPGRGKEEETTRKLVVLYIQLASSTKVNHATMVTTLQSKQPICFYSDNVCPSTSPASSLAFCDADE